MNRLPVAVAALAMSATCALAADVVVESPAYKAADSWTGVYVGANLGGVWGKSDARTTATPAVASGYVVPADIPTFNAVGTQHLNASSFFTGGVQAGYNYQIGAMGLVGIEADFQSFSTKASASAGAVYPTFTPASFTITSNVSTDWLATLRGRLGIAATRDWLVYGTGGLAVGQVTGSWSFTDNCGLVPACGGSFVPGPNVAEGASASATKFGWTVGAGAEVRLTSNWSVKAEYLYVNLGSVSATTTIKDAAFLAFYGANTNVFTHSLNVSDHIGRAGLNYRF